MIKYLVISFAGIFALVIGFTFMPMEVNVEAIVENYNNTVVYAKSKDKHEIVPTQDDAIVQQVQSQALQNSPGTNPLVLFFPTNDPNKSSHIRLTSSFGPRNISGGSKWHKGLDLNPEVPKTKGYHVLAATPGVVTFAGPGTGNAWSYGNWIEIRDERTGIKYRYAHLASIEVKKDDQITYGQQIGIVGSTGQSTGEHLHFEIRIDGVRAGVIDPPQADLRETSIDPTSKVFKYDEASKPAGGVVVQPSANRKRNVEFSSVDSTGTQ